jgi:hypothetical protein
MGNSFVPPPPFRLSTAGRMLGETELLDALQRGARQAFAFLDGKWESIPPLWWYCFVHDDWPGRERLRFNVNGRVVEATEIVVDRPPPLRIAWGRPPVASADLRDAGWLSTEEALERDRRLAGLNTAADTTETPPTPNTRSDLAGDQQAGPELRQASADRIHQTIIAVYDAAEQAGQKPPNIKEIAAPVLRQLMATGYTSSGRQIETLAGEDRHKKRRLPAGKTLASEKSRQ